MLSRILLMSEDLKVRSRAYRGIPCERCGHTDTKHRFIEGFFVCYCGCRTNREFARLLGDNIYEWFERAWFRLHQFTLPFDHQEDLGNAPKSKPLDRNARKQGRLI